VKQYLVKANPHVGLARTSILAFAIDFGVPSILICATFLSTTSEMTHDLFSTYKETNIYRQVKINRQNKSWVKNRS